MATCVFSPISTCHLTQHSCGTIFNFYPVGLTRRLNLLRGTHHPDALPYVIHQTIESDCSPFGRKRDRDTADTVDIGLPPPVPVRDGRSCRELIHDTGKIIYNAARGTRLFFKTPTSSSRMYDYGGRCRDSPPPGEVAGLRRQNLPVNQNDKSRAQHAADENSHASDDFCQRCPHEALHAL